MRLRPLLVGFGLLATAAPWRVGLRSFGPITYGMTLREARAILGDSLNPAAPGLFEGCDYVSSAAAPPGTAFMIWDSIIVRVDVDTPGVVTRSGIQVGSSEDQVRQRYPGHIRTDAHPYDGQDAHYLIYEPSARADTGFSIIFETDGGRVTRFRAGLRKAVELIEGCA
jgi:hypothetical protein